MEFTSRNCRSVLIVGFALSLLVAFVVLLISPGMISAQGSGDEATEEPIWSADMLVVEYTSVSIGAASTDLFSNVGGSAGLQIRSVPWCVSTSRFGPSSRAVIFA